MYSIYDQWSLIIHTHISIGVTQSGKDGLTESSNESLAVCGEQGKKEREKGREGEEREKIEEKDGYDQRLREEKGEKEGEGEGLEEEGQSDEMLPPSMEETIESGHKRTGPAL